MHLKLIASIHHTRAVSSINFGEHGRNLMVNLKVKCMNHCTLDFLASLYSVLNTFIPVLFPCKYLWAGSSWHFFRGVWSFFGSRMKYGFMIISFLCIAAIWISLFHHVNVNFFFPCFEFVIVSVCFFFTPCKSSAPFSLNLIFLEAREDKKVHFKA